MKTDSRAPERTLARFFLCVPLGAILALACGLAYVLYDLSPAPMPPLLADLHGIPEEVPRELTRRLAARFPIGSSEADLERELGREGFGKAAGANPARQHAYFESKAWLCLVNSEVSWSADDTGRLTWITGNYKLSCP